MENNTTYDSFQHELEDFIRKQKARGLQPQVCFKEGTKDSANKGRDYSRSTPLKLEQRLTFRKAPGFPGFYNRMATRESQSPPWHKGNYSRKGQELLYQSQKNHDYFLKSSWLPRPPVQGNTIHFHTAQYSKGAHCSWGTHTNAYHAGGQGQSQRRSPQEVRGGDDRKEEEAETEEEEEEGNCKRKHGIIGDSHKENRKKAKVELGSTDKPKHRKKSSQGGKTTRKERRSHKEKKQEGKANMQERDLWDEAILGGYY